MPADRLNDPDLKLLKRLSDGINAAQQSIVNAQAALGRAYTGMEAAQGAMSTFMDHVAEVYGIKPQDIVTFDGSIRLVDPGWAQEAAVAQATSPELEEPATLLPTDISRLEELVATAEAAINDSMDKAGWHPVDVDPQPPSNGVAVAPVFF